jgi:hypothetical protein
LKGGDESETMIDQVQNLKSNDYRKLCAKQNEN